MNVIITSVLYDIIYIWPRNIANFIIVLWRLKLKKLIFSIYCYSNNLLLLLVDQKFSDAEDDRNWLVSIEKVIFSSGR